MVTWDDNTGSMVPFGSNRTYAKEELEGRGSGELLLLLVVVLSWTMFSVK